MFSQMQFVRLRAAEKALRDGRLDEAYRLATAPDLADHRRAKAVLAELAEPFVERARARFREDQFSEALADLDRADRAGMLKDEIAELRKNVQIVAAEVNRRDHSRRERVEAARRRVEQGSLTAGKRMLERVEAHDPAIDKMKQELEDRAGEVARCLDQAQHLIDEGQFAAAATRLQRAARLDAHDARYPKLEAELCRRVLTSARSAIVEGRLARASDELTGLGPLGHDLPQRRELADALAAAREAAIALRAHRFADARRHAISLQRLVPEAKWAAKAGDALRQLEDLLTTVATGPLGDRIGENVETQKQNRDRKGAGAILGTPVYPHGETIALPGHVGTEPQAPAKRIFALPNAKEQPVHAGVDMSRGLLLLVDGGGSYLILRGKRVSIGRAASDRPADVPLFSDISERHANIERVDEDYFVFSGKELEVGGRRVQQSLLRDGDRLVLGRKAKFTFRLPSRRSTSALLELSDTTKMPHDVRRVVLLDRHAMIGHGAHAHIQCRHAGTPLLLIEKNGAFWVRRQNDGHTDTEAKLLTIGEPVEIGGVGLVLSEWSMPGRTTV
jgi:hypothetical protein